MISALKKCAIAAGLAYSVQAVALFGDDVSQVIGEAQNQNAKALNPTSDLCSVLSAEVCALITATPAARQQYPGLQADDIAVLKELMSMTPNKVADGEEKLMADQRLSTLKHSAITLGVQVGIAMESSRYNRLWVNYASLYDRMVNFEQLLIEYGYGRNIVPPVIQVMNNSQRIEAGGQVFRVADSVNRIVKQPRFAIAPPSWRDYLNFKVTQPELPVSGLMPQTDQELGFWKSQLVIGYYQGIEVTRQRVSAKYRALIQDYVGMLSYHLLREYNMISEPIVEMAHNPVLATASGSVMSIDDTVAVISVVPRFNSQARTWEVYPQLKKMSELQRKLIRDSRMLGGIH